MFGFVRPTLSHPSILYFHPERREAAGITLEELQADKHAAVEKHDEWLIDLWNKTIKKGMILYISLVTSVLEIKNEQKRYFNV